MPSAFSQIVLHTVWSTKYRRKLIDPSIDDRLHAFLVSQFAAQYCFVHEIGNSYDHIHIVHSLPRTKTIAEVVREVKSLTTMFLSELLPELDFKWQSGYATFSADYRRVDGVKAYVRNQRRHHGTEDLLP